MTTTTDPQPRQWLFTLRSGQQILVRFTDETESEIEACIRGNEWATWGIGYPGVPA